MDDSPAESKARHTDRIAAWRPLIAVAERACKAEGAKLSWKTQYGDLILLTVGGVSRDLMVFLDRLEAVANSIHSDTGALREE